MSWRKGTHLEERNLASLGHTLESRATSTAKVLPPRRKKARQSVSLFLCPFAFLYPFPSRAGVLTLVMGLPLVVSSSLYVESSLYDPFENSRELTGMTAFSEQSDPPARVQHLQKQAAVPCQAKAVRTTLGREERSKGISCLLGKEGRRGVVRAAGNAQSMLTWAAGALKTNLPQLHRPGYDMMCELVFGQNDSEGGEAA
jgi:hypothetical protein